MRLYMSQMELRLQNSESIMGCVYLYLTVRPRLSILQDLLVETPAC